MTFVKRFAFWPLLALVCMVVVGAATGKPSVTSELVGLALSAPLAALIDYRRRRTVR